MINDIYLKLTETVKEGTILRNEPLFRYTTFKTGGPADILVIPANVGELKETILLAKETETPYYIIGNGSNLLVSDDGFRGIVIAVRNADGDISIRAERSVTDGEAADTEVPDSERGAFILTADAGCPLSKVAYTAARAGLKGLEFAAGIPGSLGGAVFMNAGAYGGEIKDCISSAEVMDTDGNVFTLNHDELDLSYRHSAVGDRGLIVLKASFRLYPGSTEDILATIQDLNARRRDKQPLEYPSAGSTFKRPEGYFAGKLIEDAGLRGFAVGGACVSEKHCGFVINKGGATSADILKLIGEVSERVYISSGVRLEPEVRMLGF